MTSFKRGVQNFSGKGDETLIHVDLSTLCDSQYLDLGISIDAGTTFVNTADLVIEEPNGTTAVSLSDHTQKSAGDVVPHDTELQFNETVSGTVTDTADNPPTETRCLIKLPRGSHPELWGKNIRREQRTRGLLYVDTTGQMRAARSLKPNPCLGKQCQNKCGSLWTEESRLHLFQTYWSLGHQRQRDFIISHARKQEIKRRRVVDPEHSGRVRTSTIKFSLPCNLGNTISVCKQFFSANTGYQCKSCRIYSLQCCEWFCQA